MVTKSLKWVVLSFALLPALPAFAGVVVDYDKSVDFSVFQTYSWEEGTPAEAAFVQERIEAAIDRELLTKGLRKVDGDSDLRLITHASVETQRRATYDAFPYWTRWHRGTQWGVATIYVGQVDVGTLIVDLVDSETGRLVWRAVGTGTVRDPERNEKRINKAAKKMFKRYPPDSRR